MSERPPVFWLTRSLESLPAEDDWLGDLERAYLRDHLRFPKRRADWKLGRWTAKLAIRGCLADAGAELHLDEVQILAGPDGAPRASLPPCLAAPSFSISHRDSRAFCAVSPAEILLGCDLEHIEARDSSFVIDYFAESEIRQISESPFERRHQYVTLIWSAKESALKALRTGLRQDTRSVVASYAEESAGGVWSPLRVRCAERFLTLDGWWRREGGFVLTVAADVPCGVPVELSR